LRYEVWVKFDPDRHHRHSIRLPRHDYSRAGGYFVTVCAWHRECLFGDIQNGEISLHEAGLVVDRIWREIPRHYPYVELDVFVVMPNHFHGILHLRDSEELARRHPLSQVLRGFKAFSTREIHRSLGERGQPVWQRNYFERVIRDEAELARVRDYIVQNPWKWASDPENPEKHETNQTEEAVLDPGFL
jgi:putative transposase